MSHPQSYNRTQPPSEIFRGMGHRETGDEVAAQLSIPDPRSTNVPTGPSNASSEGETSQTDHQQEQSSEGYAHVIKLPTKVQLLYDDVEPPLAETDDMGVALVFERSSTTNRIRGFELSEEPLDQCSGLLANDELDFVKRALSKIRDGFQMVVCAADKGQHVSDADKRVIERAVQVIQKALRQHQDAARKQMGRSLPLEDLLGVLTMADDDQAVNAISNLLDRLKI